MNRFGAALIIVVLFMVGLYLCRPDDSTREK